MSLLTLLVIVLLLSAVGGGLDYSRYGYAGFSPVGLVLAIVLILYLTGRLSLR